MDEEYQSVNVPGLHFAGALSHGKDFKRSAGGFIHGFRYTARALYNILMATYEDTPWPVSTTYAFNKSPEDTNAVGMLTDMFIRQIDEAAAPYQMISTLAHGVIFECEHWPDGSSAPTRITAKYVKDVPWDYFNSKYRNYSRVAWTFSYDGQRRRLSDTIAEGTRHEVHIWEFEGPCDPAYRRQGPAANGSIVSAVPSKNVIVLEEQLHVEWNTPFNRAAILRMFTQRLSSMMNQTEGPDMCVEQDAPYSSYVESTDVDQWHIGDVWFNVINDLPIRVGVAPSNYHWDPETQTTSGSVDEWQHRAGQHLTTAPTWWQNITVIPGKGAQLFGTDDQLWNFTLEMNPAEMFRFPCSRAGIAQWRVGVTRGKVQDVLLSEVTASLPCQPFFTAFDAGGDGRVGAPELQAGFRRANIPMDEVLARNFIAIVDQDKDGTLVESEFVQILAMMKSRHGASESRYERRRSLD